NRDLWEPLLDAYRADPQRLTFTWVKGHSDDPMSDLVDRLAVEAALKQVGRAGDGPPDESTLGPADAVGPGAPDPRVPAGRKLVVLGHKPTELGAYEVNAGADELRRKLADIFTAKLQLFPDLVVLTGLGLGAEQLGAEAADEAGV